MWCATDNLYVCHISEKEFLDWYFNEVVINKISYFSQNGPKFHILAKFLIVKV